MDLWQAEHPERLQQRTVHVLVATQVLGGAAIGVGAAVSPLLAKEILGGDDTFAGLAFAALTFGSALAAVPLSRLMSRRGRRPGLVRGYLTATAGAARLCVPEPGTSIASLPPNPGLQQGWPAMLELHRSPRRQLAGDLVDARTVFTFPVVLGGGKKPRADTLAGSRAPSTGVTIGHYERAGKVQIGDTALESPANVRLPAKSA